MVCVFLADGFEVIEALAPVDMLGRAKINVKTVGVTGKHVISSGGVEIVTDITKDEVSLQELEMIILPGGMPGTLNLEADESVQQTIDYCVEKAIPIASICAAPSILAHKGLLDGKKATVFPAFAKDLKNASYTGGTVEVDGIFITARGAGVATEFGLKCVEILTSKSEADTIKAQIQS